jgi:hypothetical protein
MQNHIAESYKIRLADRLRGAKQFIKETNSCYSISSFTLSRSFFVDARDALRVSISRRRLVYFVLQFFFAALLGDDFRSG